ncbi:hypothetical protein Pcinc_023087 [Petrolisthes cinctipes]|uniref:Uncharacterized protein n=1 Tax=Petrolisthes cinctipes TaxID=88211 RepID=A0AAE1FCQ0_PETCI|nr:hypothetical protein Pcinc_023087 [Petrolisthes cinctipes]
MDIEAIKVLLEAQDRAFKSAMDIVIEQLTARIQAAEKRTEDVVKSLEFTQAEMSDLLNEVKVLRQSDSENQGTINVLKLQIEELTRRSNYQEDYNRRSNLRFTGIQEHHGETWEETAVTVTKLIEEKLQLPAVKLERAHRTGPVIPTRHRVIVARFERFGEREAVLRNSRKLKVGGVTVDGTSAGVGGGVTAPSGAGGPAASPAGAGGPGASPVGAGGPAASPAGAGGPADPAASPAGVEAAARTSAGTGKGYAVAVSGGRPEGGPFVDPTPVEASLQQSQRSKRSQRKK